MCKIGKIIVLYVLASPIFAQTLADTIPSNVRDSLIPDFPLELYKVHSSEFHEVVILDTANYLTDISSFDNSNTLNNLGTAIRDIQPHNHYTPLNHGYTAFLPYGTKSEDFKYVYCNKPITDISYKQGRSLVNSQTTFQNNYHLNLLLASTFNKKINVTLQYNKLSHQGIYSHQRNKQSSFASGLRYTGKKGRFNINFLYIWNLTKSEENNGITSDSFLILDGFRIRSSIPVNSTTAQKDINENQLAIQYSILPDSSSRSIVRPRLFFQHSFKKFNYNFEDNQPLTSAQYYGILFIDSTTIKNHLTQGLFSNGLRLELFHQKPFQSGIVALHEYSIWEISKIQTYSNMFKLGAFARWNITNTIPITFTFSFATKGGASAQNYEASIQYAHSKFQADLNLFRNEYFPSLLQERLYLNDTWIWNESLKSIGELGVDFRFHFLNKFLPSITVRASNYSNYIGLDTTGRIRQLLKNMQSIQFSIASKVYWKWLGIHNTFYLNAFSPDEFHFSSWNSDHELLVRLSLFKKAIDAQIGVYANIVDASRRLQYQSITGSYFASNEPFKPYMSNGLRFRLTVSNFRAHLDLDYLDSFWNSNRPYLVKVYPFYDFYFRFGIQWRFLY